jgi:hypothetical protein
MLTVFLLFLSVYQLILIITHSFIPSYLFHQSNRIGGVMVSVLTSSAVDRGFEPRSGQTKNYKIGMCCFSAKHAALRRKSKTGWLGIRIMCPSGATFLSADCCFNELALYKSNSTCWSRTKQT